MLGGLSFGVYHLNLLSHFKGAVQLNIEKFVHRSLDTSQTRSLLELLGVRSQPQSAAKLMQRLRALAETSQPLLTHVLDLYRALDGVYSYLDSEGRVALQTAFEEEALILDDDGSWQRRPHIYQANDEELPGIAVIHREMRSLGLWDRINVDRSPTLDKVLDWLRRLPSRTEIAPLERRRVTAVLSRTPRTALDACNHWLSRTGAWIPWQELRFFVVSRAADAEGDGPLSLHVRRQVADFSMLTATQVELLKGHLRPLREVLTHEVDATQASPALIPEWVKPLALGILRAQPEGDLEETQDPETAEFQDRLEAVDLYYSNLQKAQALRLVPFLEGVQVGTPATARALWEGQSLYVVGPEPSHHRELVEQIERRFSLKMFKVAVGDCVGCSSSFVDDYFTDGFSLRPLSDAEFDLGLTSASTRPAPTALDHMTTINADEKGSMNHHGDEPISDASGADLHGSEEPAYDDQSVDAEFAPDSVPDRNEELEEQQATEEQTEETHSDVDVPESNADRRRASVRQSPLQVYLVNKGFRYDENSQHWLRQSDRAMVNKDPGSAFYLQYDADGDIQMQYWEHHAPITESIVIPADVWLYLEREPGHCLILVLGRDGQPVALPAETLLRWKVEQHLTLTATAYRLNFSNGWEELQH